MNRSKSNVMSSCQVIKEEFDDAMTTPLAEFDLFDESPGESPQMSSTLGHSSTDATDSNSPLPNEPSVERGTLMEQFNQLMAQQRLLVFGGLDRLQQMMEEGQNKIRKQYDEWELKVSEVRTEAIKGREEIETILAGNRAVLASIASTSATVFDYHYPSVLADGDCSASSSNQVPPESPSYVSSTPAETVQSPNVNVSNINHEHLDEQQLNNEDTSTNVADVTSNIENGGDNSGTVLEGQEREDNANYSSDQTVVHSDLSPSTSTGRGWNRIDVSLSPSQTVHSPNVSHIKQEHFDERVDNEPKVDDVIDGSTSGLRSSTRRRIQTKVFGVDQLTQGDKRKSDKTESTKATKRIKPGRDDEAHQEDEGADKVRVVTLELNCTAPGCKSILNTFDEWNEHLWTVHGLILYQELVDNARDNQDCLTEYPCTECEVVSKSQRYINQHWRHYHQAGKFECSVCGFGANFRSDILNHQLRDHRTRKRSRRAHHGRDKAVSGNDHLEQPTEQSHSGETNQFKCTWDNCEASFIYFRSAIRHVRSRHFHLPRTFKEQEELNIIDEGDPKDYVQM